MSRVTENLKPERLWYHFEEISKIPRCSKHEEKVLEYIESWAKGKGLETKRDAAGNLVVVKKADPGMENKPTIILQGHVDMVCEKNKGTVHDFSKDPLKLVIDGDWVTADGTTLGADNAIGVTAGMALLEDPDVKTGQLELLCTFDEETGLTGAFTLDPSLLTGKIMLNLDSEEEGAIYIGCAGGRDSDIELPLSEEDSTFEMEAIEVKITGLRGGHSGLNINEGRGNAVKLLGRALYSLSKSVVFNISHIDGGDKHNAIPREATATILINRNAVELAKNTLNAMGKAFQEEFKIVEPGLELVVTAVDRPETMFDLMSTDDILSALMIIPFGVLNMSAAVDGLVESSTNLAAVHSEHGSLQILCSHRSSIASAIDWQGDMHRALAEVLGADISQDEGYPGWTPNPDSPLLAIARKSFEKALGYEPEVKAIHAGLECGIIGEKCGGLDTISFGPTIEGAHSPDERVGIKSTEVFWKCLLTLVEDIYAGA
ncbi:MAG: aminoacyl-histidine dipeptidase [Acidobacteria bacterium]|nr:aminoacyl-histidine dipeptidase [Acidobacteriota bacterium]